MNLPSILLLVHVLGACTWVGGTIAIPIGAIVIRRRGGTDPVVRFWRIHALGRRLAWVMWPALAVTIATGLGNLAYFLPAGAEWYSSGSAPWFFAKFTAVAVAIGASSVHSFVLAPRAARRLRSGVPYSVLAASTRWSRRLGFIALVASVAIVAFAIGLAQTG